MGKSSILRNLNQIASAIFWRPIFNLYTLPGMIWVEGTHVAPFAARMRSSGV